MKLHPRLAMALFPAAAICIPMPFIAVAAIWHAHSLFAWTGAIAYLLAWFALIWGALALVFPFGKQRQRQQVEGSRIGTAIGLVAIGGFMLALFLIDDALASLPWLHTGRHVIQAAISSLSV